MLVDAGAAGAQATRESTEKPARRVHGRFMVRSSWSKDSSSATQKTLKRSASAARYLDVTILPASQACIATSR
jgi:hypothetical protein